MGHAQSALAVLSSTALRRLRDSAPPRPPMRCGVTALGAETYAHADERSKGSASALVDQRLDVGWQVEDGKAGPVRHPDLILPTVLVPEQRMSR